MKNLKKFFGQVDSNFDYLFADYLVYFFVLAKKTTLNNDYVSRL